MTVNGGSRGFEGSNCQNIYILLRYRVGKETRQAFYTTRNRDSVRWWILLVLVQEITCLGIVRQACLRLLQFFSERY